ncbi:MAG: DUF3144 domain-containing protein [Gammaproteobacteria bacterium]
MAEKPEELSLYAMADQFIDVANRLIGEGGQDLSRVSAAIRFAAARFNAHEAAHQAQDVAADKDNAVSWFTYQYQKMFVENIDEHIQLAEKLGKPDA